MSITVEVKGSIGRLSGRIAGTHDRIAIEELAYGKHGERGYFACFYAGERLIAMVGAYHTQDGVREALADYAMVPSES